MPLLELAPRFQKARRLIHLRVVRAQSWMTPRVRDVWKMASPNGDTLAGDKAVPYVVNFQMVDTDKDGKISAAEFKTGCGKGWVQSADASTTKQMTPPAKL